MKAMNSPKSDSRQESKNNKRITAAIVMLGVLTVVVALVITFIMPTKTSLTHNMAQGFFTPVIAFELARTPMDLAFITGADAATTELRNAFRTGLQWDMLFPFLYGGFILLLLIKALRSEGEHTETTTKLGVLFAFTIPFTDLLENWAMLRILNVLDAQGTFTGRILANLELTTWLKWLFIGLAFGMLMIHFYTQTKNKVSNQTMPAVMAGFCFVSTLAAFTTLSPLMGEIMGLSVVICIAYFLIKNSRELLLHIKP